MDQPPQSTGQTQNRQQPVYDTRNGGHYGASAALSAQGYAPVAELYTGTWANVNQGLQGNSRDILTTYWQHIINHLESDNHDYKIHQLPLARIKKVMKADPEVKMISAEAPILFAKGCDIFITELTMRAWIHAEDNKRRTLQRSDIAAALSKSDMFDFLIDIVPREEATSHAKRSGQASTTAAPPQDLQPQGRASYRHHRLAFSIHSTIWDPRTTGLWDSMLCLRSRIIDLSQRCTLELFNPIHLGHMGRVSHQCSKACIQHTPISHHSRYVCLSVFSMSNSSGID